MKTFTLTYQLKYRKLRWSTHTHQFMARSPEGALARMVEFLDDNYTTVNPGFQYRNLALAP